MNTSGKSSVPSEQVLADKDVPGLFFKLLNLLILSYLSSPFHSLAPLAPLTSPRLFLPVVRVVLTIFFFCIYFLDGRTDEHVRMNRQAFQVKKQ